MEESFTADLGMFTLEEIKDERKLIFTLIYLLKCDRELKGEQRIGPIFLIFFLPNLVKKTEEIVRDNLIRLHLQPACGRQSVTSMVGICQSIKFSIFFKTFLSSFLFI